MLSVECQVLRGASTALPLLPLGLLADRLHVLVVRLHRAQLALAHEDPHADLDRVEPPVARLLRCWLQELGSLGRGVRMIDSRQVVGAGESV